MSVFVRERAAVSNGGGAQLPVLLEQITPQRAAELLENNACNRKVTRSKVKQYAGAMMRGEWMSHGGVLMVDSEGRLIQGQHRLLAVIDAGVTLPMAVWYDCPPEVQIALDTGRKRTLGDMLSMRGEPDPGTLAAALVRMYRFALSGNFSSTGGERQPTIPQLFSVLEVYPGLRESVVVGRKLANDLRYPRGEGTSLHLLFGFVDQEDCAVFFDRLLTGERLTERDPILVLRNALFELNQRNRTKQLRTNPNYVAALTIKAFNAWREGREVTRISWMMGGARKEAFPSIEGLPEVTLAGVGGGVEHLPK